MNKFDNSILWPCCCLKVYMKHCQTPLHVAVQTANMDWIRKILIQGACVNMIDQNRKSALHYAIDIDNSDIIKLLLKTKTCDINLRGNVEFHHPLHYAVKHNRLKACKVLLDAGARIDMCNTSTISSEQKMVQTMNIDIFEMLFRKTTATVVDNVLFHPVTHLAAINGFYDLYWLMFNEYSVSINLRDQTFSTVLHYVVRRGDLDEVKRLVLGGIDVNLLDNREWNALQYAISLNYTSIAVYLIENGSIENKTCAEQHWPLNLAALCGHIEMLMTLIEIYKPNCVESLWDIVLRLSILKHDRTTMVLALNMGARVDSSSGVLEKASMTTGTTGLHLAVLHSTLKDFDFLLKQSNANVDIQTKEGLTPLHYCGKYNEKNKLDLLLDQYHADPTILTIANENAFLLALLHNHIDLAEHILSRVSKIELNRAYQRNKTLLEHGIMKNTAHCVNKLLDMGADPNLSFEMNSSPLRLAIDSGSTEIFDSLVNYGADTQQIFKFVEPDKGPRKQINDPFRVRYHEWKVFSYAAYNCHSNLIQHLIDKYRWINPCWKTDLTIIDAFTKCILLNSSNKIVDIIDTFNILLKNGFNTDTRDDLTGKYPIHTICEALVNLMQNEGILLPLILRLIDFKTNLNAKDYFQRTALHIIASDKKHCQHIYRILIKSGANKYLIDSDGRTPNEIAMEHDQNQRMIILRNEKYRLYDKFNVLTPKLHLANCELVGILNQNVLIRKLLPYNTKRLKLVELNDDKNVIKKIETLTTKHQLSEFLLNWVFRSAVHFKPNSEELEIRQTVHHLLNDLLTEVGHIDDRFIDSRLIPSGSGYEGFKMDKPDEFDFLFEFGQSDFTAEENIHFIETNDPCFLKLAVHNRRIQNKWRDFIDEKENLLNASKLRLYTVLLMRQASLKNNFRIKWWRNSHLHFNIVPYHEGCPHCQIFVSQSKVGAILHVEWNGIKYKNLSISIDVAPAIAISNQWPAIASKHPLNAIDIEDFTQWGYHLVTKADYNLCDMFAWRISFSVCEYQIFSRLNLCQSACFAVLKLLRMPFEDVLTSWMWKSMFFQHLATTKKDDWDNIEKLCERVSNCLSYIWQNEFSVEPVHVQSFFIKDQIIDPTDATLGYNVKNIFLALNYLKLIQRKMIKIIKNC